MNKVVEVLHKNVALSQTIIEYPETREGDEGGLCILFVDNKRYAVTQIGDYESPAHSALKHSFITRRDLIKAAKLEQV